NNRDLRTFEVDLQRGIELLNRAPEETVLVSESGLSSAEDLKVLFDNDIHAALIGEYFMRQPNPGEGVQNMLRKLQGLLEGDTSVFEDEDPQELTGHNPQ
ncbi:MAG: hypothetical protein R3222_09160, partial [Balneolaceae bacterium]|nr:hypothetical protein [Balneolaceae bacterium]